MMLRSLSRVFLALSLLVTTVFLVGMTATAAEKKKDLKKKDFSSCNARSSPQWLTRGVLYQVWLRGFTPEGTLKAATQRLPQVADLGASVIYLCPVSLSDDDMREEFWSNRQKISKTNNPRNPYRIKDYYKVDPEYGTDADLREFVATAHKLGLKVLLDLVYFHCGPTSVVLEHPDWVKHDLDGKVSTGQWHFPVLNFESQGLREHLWGNMIHWVKNFDMDGFRCDVAGSVPLDFWEEARTRLDAIRPDLVILAEGEQPADQVKAFDIDYGFSWYRTTRDVFAKGQPADSLRKNWEDRKAKWPRGSRFMRYTENHDLVNDLYRVDAVCGERGALAMAIINFTIDGVPLLYNGQEIGDTSLQSIYARFPVRWEGACLPKAAAKYALYKKLCELRHKDPALFEGQTVWLDNDQPDSVVSFLRRTDKCEILTVASLSNRKVKVEVTLPEDARGKYSMLLSDQAKLVPAAGKATLELGGSGYFVGKAE
jgi:glycosidase